MHYLTTGTHCESCYQCQSRQYQIKEWPPQIVSAPLTCTSPPSAPVPVELHTKVNRCHGRRPQLHMRNGKSIDISLHPSLLPPGPLPVRSPSYPERVGLVLEISKSTREGVWKCVWKREYFSTLRTSVYRMCYVVVLMMHECSLSE